MKDPLAPLLFYFDFISPYGWFAALRIDALAARHGRTTAWSSMLLGVSVMKVMGLRPLMETPLKSDYARADVQRYARRHGLTLGRDLDAQPMNPLNCGRAFHWALHHHPAQAVPLALRMLDAYWRQGLDLSLPESLAQLPMPDGLEPARLVQGASSPEAAALLRAAVDASIKAGIFGSPTVVVDGQLFWGVDRLDEVDGWLASGGW
jgi:2-hydroxychromene-2-carboxylate isomerase